MVRVGEVEQHMAKQAPVEFNQHIEVISDLILETIPRPDDRVRMRNALETLMFGLSREWIGCKAVWPTEIPDTIEGIEDL